MNKAPKHFLPLFYFLLGSIGAFFVIRFQQTTFASQGDPRVKTTESSEVSGLKAPVPLTNEMTAALNKREEELAQRERVLKEREETLAVEENRVRLRIDELTKLQDELEKLEKKDLENSEQTFKRMVKTFESMSPKKASGVISVMQDDLAIRVLLGMKEKRTAAILDVMDPNRAMTLSSLMARRKPAGRAANEGQASPNPGGQAPN